MQLAAEDFKGPRSLRGPAYCRPPLLLPVQAQAKTGPWSVCLLRWVQKHLFLELGHTVRYCLIISVNPEWLSTCVHVCVRACVDCSLIYSQVMQKKETAQRASAPKMNQDKNLFLYTVSLFSNIVSTSSVRFIHFPAFRLLFWCFVEVVQTCWTHMRSYTFA